MVVTGSPHAFARSNVLDMSIAMTANPVRRAVLIALYCVGAAATPAAAAELPVACAAGSCGAGVPGFVSQGSATAVSAGNTLTVNQTSANAVLNWRSFNISADAAVNFQQPGNTSVALNQIFQGSASQILGALNANGRVYLINQNGILFGAGSRVNVGGLVASSLNITPAALQNGIAQAAKSGAPAFAAFADASGNVPGAVEVQQGARIEAASGGQVFLFAPERVVNEGTIVTPDGQTILAAGSAVYLATSGDENLRGLLVEVNSGGEVTNGRAGGAAGRSTGEIVGQIVAERGNVTLAGLAVNQQGRISSTTSVRANGSIRLQARDSVTVTQSGTDTILAAGNGGELTVGEGAVNEVTLALSDQQTQVDINEQPLSTIMMDGARVNLLEGSRTTANAGSVTITARNDPQASPSNGSLSAVPDDSRLYIANGATIDVSGADIELAMESNVVTAELRGSQVANSPQQRDGTLRGQTVYVDARRSGTREDGTTWYGTPLADVNGDIAAVGKTVGQRSLNGGTVSLQSQGSVLVDRGASIDVSGGSITYQDGFIDTTKVVSNGRTYDIGDADPDRHYEGIGNVLTIEHPKWGVKETFIVAGNGTHRHFEQGYVEGKDAGSVSVIAPWLAFDGSVDGSVVRGERQRLPGTAVPSGRLYRDYNQVAAGGRLEFGYNDTSPTRNSVLGDVRIAPGLVLPTLLNEQGEPFDPRTDLLPQDLGAVRIRPELLGASGAASLTVYSNGQVTVPADVQITTPAGGSFTAAGAAIRVDGSIDAPAGSINLTARESLTSIGRDISLQVGAQSRLSANGLWVNDSALLNAPDALLDPLFTSGGRITLSSQQGGLTLAEGSRIDVYGGAWLQADGQFTAGKGGDVSLGTSPNSIGQNLAEPVPFFMGAQISGHSFGAGGQLSITANAVCVAVENCSEGQDALLWVQPQLLEESGFGSYRLVTNRDGLNVLPGTLINLQQRNLELLGGAPAYASGSSVLDFSRITMLDSLLRRPVNLSLTAGINPGGVAVTNATFAELPDLEIGTGAAIFGDAGAQIALRSNTRLLIDGILSAPAGTITAQLDPTLALPLNGAEFLDSQGIWLGEHAQLLATGTARVSTDDTNRRQGEVLGGGSVSIAAPRGYVFATPGSRIDVSGATAVLDLPTSQSGGYAATPVASDAGRISISAAEGFFLSGDLAAHGGGAGARGGELSLALDPTNRNDPGTTGPVFPEGARTITVSADDPTLAFQQGVNVPRILNGQGQVGAETIERGGFDSLKLTARELARTAGSAPGLQSLGVIRFEGDTQLSLGRSITLDAASIDVVNGSAELAAPYVSLGASSRLHQNLPALRSGESQLSIDADLLDIYGNLALQGIQAADLTSSGDIRFRGVQLLNARELEGSLVSAGDLTFTAQQLYPTTLSDFEVEVRATDGSIDIRGSAGTPAPVLSAGGSLTLRADSIEQAGTMRAPFGSITLAGDHVTLLAGSTTSTSAGDLLIPFGQTQGGFDWVYPLLDQGSSNEQTLVFGRGDDDLPQQRVVLDGPDIRIQEGATVDLSAGGDLLAYEFEPGVGGTRDVLSNTYRPNQYAVIPGLGYAPFDQSLWQDSNLTPGDSVFISGAPGLAAGTYALLPARYALLPGAYLVTATEGYQDILPGNRFAQLDGSTVVAGYRTTLNTDLRDARYSGFAVRKGADAQREARYVLTRATDFFPAQALREDIATPRLPNDAGILSINASGTLELEGSLRATAGEGGRGAGVDISGTRLRIVAEPSEAAEGEVVISAAALNSLGAESVLLGARREQTAEGLRLDVAATEVTIDAGAQLAAPELMLAAKERVLVESGAVLSATGSLDAGDSALLVAGDGALLRASSGAQVRIERTDDVGVSGTLTVEEDAVIRARDGAVLFDATRDSASRGQLDIAGASLNLAASRISLGQDVDVADGLLLDAAQFAGLDLRELVLTSRSVLDLYGAVDLGVQDLTIHAGGIVSRSPGAASLSASDSLTLANPNDVAAPGLLDGSGTVTLASREIQLGAGDFAIAGTSTTRLQASDRIVAGGDGKTHVSGDLQLTAARITTASGADHKIVASGVLTTARADSPAAQPAPIDGVGGRLHLQGERIVHGGHIEMPAGIVQLEAVGQDESAGVTLAAGSAISVAGMSRDFGGVDIAVSGGAITLTAQHGSVVGESGSAVDVSGAASGSDAGKVTVQAVQGSASLASTMRGHADAGHEGGSITMDAATLVGFDDLNSRLNAAGFNQSRTFRQRGAGDLTISAASGAAIKAHNVSITADAGSVAVNGVIDASGKSGGSISLSASQDIVVAGSLLANATGAGGRGGEVLLASVDGGVSLQPSATIDVSAGAAQGAESVRKGEVHVRVSRDSALSVLDGDATNDQLQLAGNVIGAGRYWLEGYQAYASDGVIDSQDVAAAPGNPLYDAALAFVNNADALAAALNLAADSAFKVVPGIELRSAGDLTLSADWNLYDWHFANDTPGMLTLRAGGNLVFDRSLSDGFVSVTDFMLANQRRESWSYRLIGGADLSSANTLAAVSAAELAADSGSVKVSAGTCCVPVDPFNVPDYRMIRTGTGNITIAAGRDLVLGNPDNRSALDQTAMIYTAGVSGPGIRLEADLDGLRLPYPIDGGDISIHAGGSVRGATSNQLVTDWLWRVGGVDTPTAWTVNFSSFMQGVGALAGGNIDVVANGDIENLSLNLPSIGRQVGGLDVRDNQVEIVGAGELRVDAGGSILGGTYLVGNGSGRVRSQASIAVPDAAEIPGLPSPVGTLLGIVGSGSYDVAARENVEIDAVFNATLIKQGEAQRVNQTSYFNTYGAGSSIDLFSASGDVVLHNDLAIASRFTSVGFSDVDAAALFIYPGTLRSTAFDGDVEVIRSMLLSPAPKGNLQLFAQDDIAFGDGEQSLVLTLSDTDLSILPSVQKPTDSPAFLLNTLLRSPFDPAQHGPIPAHSDSLQTDGIPDLEPVRIVARSGDIYMNVPQEGGVTGLYLAKQAQLSAGRDIRDLTLFGQHVRNGDVTTLAAGRDVVYSLDRTARGSLVSNSGGLTLDGPGRLELIAGRHVDLQTSNGITTRGNIRNPALADSGASVSILTGIAAQAPDYAEFVDVYLREGSAYDAALIAYLGEIGRARQMSKEQALGEFAALDAAVQRGFIERVLFAELLASGRVGAVTKDYSRGFEALATLFPGGNPDLDAGETNAYSGDFNGYFSRVYTLDGGDINLLAPGGQINVGLATPPAAFGVSKAASELGIVAQSTGSVAALSFGDFAVNESRVFAADGGDILVWTSRGDIDAGRGAKTAISAPAPTITFDANGNVQVNFGAALAGSGIQALATSEGREPGDVDLFAPRGIVNASDAGIVAGNLTIGAVAVLGTDNIKVSGVSVGVPVDAGGLGASLSGVSNVASSASSAAAASVETGGDQKDQAPLADTAMSWLDVFVVGLGEEQCDPKDIECLKRQQPAD